MASHDRVRVVIRFRPIKDVEHLGHVAIDRHTHAVQIRDPSNSAANGSWQFDAILDSAATNEEVYSSVAADVVTSSLAGINGTIFAYGQTSSGKTFSMRSIMQQAFDTVFATAAADTDKKFEIAVRPPIPFQLPFHILNLPQLTPRSRYSFLDRRVTSRSTTRP